MRNFNSEIQLVKIYLKPYFLYESGYKNIDDFEIEFTVTTNKKQYGLKKIYQRNHIESIFDRIWSEAKRELETIIFKEEIVTERSA